MRNFDPHGQRLPIKIDTATNGEYAPRPLPEVNRAANALARERAGKLAKALGLSRRNFLVSSCGAAATLLAFDEVHAANGGTGGRFVLSREAALEPAAAEAALGGDEVIFDIQGHHMSPIGKWLNPKAPWFEFSMEIPRAQACRPGPADGRHLECLSRDVFVKEMFLDSDTAVGVLTFVPSIEEDMPLSTEEAAITKSIVDALDGTERLLLHGRVIPNAPGDIQRMDKLVKQWSIAAWKTYTQFAEGWWLDDPKVGIPFIERVRELGPRLICIHKGIPLAPMGRDLTFSRCDDVGRVARRFPDVTFIIYHSGWDPAYKEGPFTAGAQKGGVDTLIQSLVDNGVAPNSNVYAELGSTWREMMKSPDEAAHVLGKLLKYVGEDRVVWGTDCIWYGSPQDQIQAFRAFQISDEFCEKYGYSKLTPDVKRKIFGLNAAKPYGVDLNRVRRRLDDDAIGRARAACSERNPTFLTYGPRTRREFLQLKSMESHA
jgi:predicted TIM-barrel fold metal-dependent hydrolase